jgi:haloalkane dehalogenase
MEQLAPVTTSEPPADFSVRRSLVDVGDGQVLSVADVGSGPVILFSHGTPTWSYEWRHLIAGLSGRYRCIAPDHLGFGLSPRPPDGDYSPEAHAARFGRLIEALGIERYHLVVHDFGGPIALASAVRAPTRPRSLTAFNTFAWAFGDTPRTRAMAWLAGTRLFRWAYGAVNLSFLIARSAWGKGAKPPVTTWAAYARIFPDADSRRLVLWALAKSMRSSSVFCESLWQRRAALRDVPAAIIWGLADSAFRPEALARLHLMLPQASVHRLVRAGHWPHEEEPDVCLDILGKFLDGLPSG